MVHPVERIRGSYSRSLSGKCIVLGITGSVAAYKAIDTARWLIRRGARVVTVATQPALELLGAKLLEWATGERVVSDLTGEVEHISLSWECDLMLVAPATISTMAKIAYGIADNPVALTAISMLGQGKPVIVAPAMHESMMRSSQYEEVEALLARRGVTIIPPKVEEGVAKYPDPSFIARVASSVALRGRDLAGSRILVTAGPTREWIDPVRYISNPSSGLMGLEVALEAYARGAEVDIVYGVTSWEPPHVLKAWHAETTEEMAEKVAELTGSTRYDAIVAAAAPLDFRPEKKAGEKIRSGVTLELKLVPTPKVLEAIRFRPKILVAYAAETTSEVDRLIESARAKLEKYQADLVVANVVGSGDVGFSSKYVKAVLVEPGGFKVLDKILKEDLARLLMDHVASRLRVANP